MKLIYLVPIYSFLAFSIFIIVHGQNSTEVEVTDNDIDDKQSYCFRFTWIGPDFDNNTNYNVTSCESHFGTKDSRGIPCKQPLVITHNGTPPDIDYLWTNHKKQVLCRRTKGKRCVKYSYSLNGAVDNITYMCAKVIAKGEGTVKSGCYKQIINDYDVEYCVCDSPVGYKPCNSVSRNYLNFLLLIFSYLLVSCFYHKILR